MNLPLSQREQYAKGGVGRWYWDYRDRRILSYIGEERNILDVGCGEGITLERLVKAAPGRNIQGIDSSGENIAICEKYRLPARLGNAYALEFSGQSMDCCLFLEVVEHLEEPGKALREIHRVLKKGGLLLLLFPHDWLFKASRLCFLKFKEAYAPSGHVRQWTPAEMARELTGVGFRVQEMVCLPFRFWRSSLHCLVAARKE